MAKISSLYAATLRRQARRLRRNSLFWDVTTREEIRQRAREIERHAATVEQERAARETGPGDLSRQEA